MKITVNENNDLQLEKVYTGVILVSDDRERFGICMRDSGFEFNYGDGWHEAKKGSIRFMRPANNDKPKRPSNWDFKHTPPPPPPPPEARELKEGQITKKPTPPATQIIKEGQPPEKPKEFILRGKSAVVEFNNTAANKLKEIKEKLSILKTQQSELISELNDLETQFKKTCTHEKTNTKSQYFEGGYLNTNRTEYKKVCQDCGEILKEWDVDHGNYA